MGWRGEMELDQEAARREAMSAGGRAGGTASFKLNRHRFELVVSLIKAGNYAKVACASVGITEGTYGNYLRRGRAVAAMLVEALGEDHGCDEETEHCPGLLADEVTENDWTCYRFMGAIEKASAEGEAGLVLEVRAGVKENPQLGLQILERRHPRRWKRRDMHEIVAADAREGEGDLLDEESSVLVHQALAAAALNAGQGVVEGTARRIHATGHVIEEDA